MSPTEKQIQISKIKNSELGALEKKQNETTVLFKINSNLL
jgi:hypothetical protein